MIVENIFEDKIFPELKQYVEEKSIYNPTVTKAMPQQRISQCIVPVKLLPVTNKYNNLSYGEETYTFGIKVEIYAIASGKTSKRTICNEVAEQVVNYFKTNYHVTIKTELDVINADSNVHRNIVNITGILDTKYGLDNLVIYPN